MIRSHDHGTDSAVCAVLKFACGRLLTTQDSEPPDGPCHASWTASRVPRRSGRVLRRVEIPLHGHREARPRWSTSARSRPIAIAPRSAMRHSLVLPPRYHCPLSRDSRRVTTAIEKPYHHHSPKLADVLLRIAVRGLHRHFTRGR